MTSYQKRYEGMPRPVMGSNRGSRKLWRRAEIEEWALSRASAPRRSDSYFADSFLSTIEASLDEGVDASAFEACAVDLASQDFSVALVKGGSDGGFDGAIADAQGAPFPLVVTTAQDALGNLKRNLDRYLKEGGLRRKAVFVSSRSLSHRKRTNLLKAAEARGVTLIQIFDQSAVAVFLSRHPDWCQRLLGLSGEAPPLSIVPRSGRRLVRQPLIARSDELQWLIEADHDVALVGQPGSGKTSLLEEFSHRTGALFLVGTADSSLTSHLRAMAPTAVIVDGAHDTAELEALVRLRVAIGADFRIVASCWPSDSELVLSSLGLGPAASITLERLTREEIVQVVRLAGISGPSSLVRELVDQANGMPGLATTLANVIIRGGLTDISLGNAIKADVKYWMQGRLGDRGFLVLAAAAIGGKQGVDIEEASSALGLSIADVTSVAQTMADAGVIYAGNARTIAVQPEALRVALVHEAYFARLVPLPFDRHLATVVDPGSTTADLAAMSARGLEPPQPVVRSALERFGDDVAWANYASSSRKNATYALTHRPDVLKAYPMPFLALTPREALRQLLSDSRQDTRSLGPNPDHPLRAVQDWVHAAGADVPANLERRGALFEELAAGVLDEADDGVAGQAVAIGLSPDFDQRELDPGAGTTIHLRFGIVGEDCVSEILKIWDRYRGEIIPHLDTISFMNIVHAIHEWVFPTTKGGLTVSESLATALRKGAEKLIADLAGSTRGHPGLESSISKMAIAAGIESSIVVDSTFDLLYGRDNGANWREDERLNAEEIRALASSWSRDSDNTIALRLTEYERLAAEIGHTWPRRSLLLSESLINEMDKPLDLVTALIEQEAPTDLVRAATLGLSAVDTQSAVQAARSMLDSASYASVAVEVLLCCVNLKPNDPVFSAAGLSAAIASSSVLQDRIRSENIAPLLQSSDQQLRAEVARALWSASDGIVPDTLSTLWKRVIVADVPLDMHSGYWLAEILLSDLALAEQWIEQRFKEDELRSWVGLDGLEEVFANLDLQQRIRLLNSVPNTWANDFVVRALVGDSEQAFSMLLQKANVGRLQLAPLAGEPSERWFKLASEAIRQGIAANEVAEATFHMTLSWFGDESSFWDGWGNSFALLRPEADGAMRDAIDHGVAIAADLADRARAQERNEEVYGIR